MSRTRDITLHCEGETLASTGPLPHGPSVHFSSRSCADVSNQPVGLEFVTALIHAAVLAHEQARCATSTRKANAPGLTEGSIA